MRRKKGPKRRWRRWIIGGVAAVVVLAIAVPFVVIHFVEGTPKAALALPGPRAVASSGGGPATGDVAGTWRVSSGSQAGYRVQEVLVGQSTTAVGRTPDVTGTFELRGHVVEAASFTVDMATVVSDQSERNAQFDGRIMDVARYRTATFRLTDPVDLGAVPSAGRTIRVAATGTLDMHGVTRSITIPLSAERLGSTIDVLGDADVVFARWNIENPSVAGFVKTADHGTLEVILHLTRA